MKTVFRYIFRYEEAIDVVTDGFVKLFRGISSFNFQVPEQDVEKLFIGWMKRIMINAAIDRLRKKSMLPEVGLLPEEAWQVADSHADAEQSLLYKELITHIKKLPPNYRAVFNLYVIDGYAHHEIAVMLDIPIGTSKSNLSRARVLLQEKIKQADTINYASGQ